MQRTAPAFNIRFIGRRKKLFPKASFYCIAAGRNIQAIRCIFKCFFGYFTGRGGRILRINRNLKGGHNRIFRLHLFRKLRQARIVPFYVLFKMQQLNKVSTLETVALVRVTRTYNPQVCTKQT